MMKGGGGGGREDSMMPLFCMKPCAGEIYNSCMCVPLNIYYYKTVYVPKGAVAKK